MPVLFLLFACMSKTNQRLEAIEARLDALEQQQQMSSSQPAMPVAEASRPPQTQQATKTPVIKPGIRVEATAGQLKVAVEGASVSVVELKCLSSRTQTRLDKQVAVFSEFPDESCNMYFKPTPATFGPFKPTQGVLYCTISGGGAAVNCR